MALNLDGTNLIVTANIGNSQVTAAKLASGAARANFGAGCVLQVVQGVKSDVTTGLTSTSWATISGLSATITPSSFSNKILVIANIKGQSSSNATTRLMRDSTPICINTQGTPGSRAIGSGGDFYGAGSAPGVGQGQTHIYLDSPGSAGSFTYTLQYQVNTGTFNVNTTYADVDSSGTSRGVSTITLVEIAG
jgi:hypothetical protein